MKIEINKHSDMEGKLVINISMILDINKDKKIQEEGIMLNIKPEDLSSEVSSKELLEYFEKYCKSYKKTDKRMLKACCRHFKLYAEITKCKILNKHICNDFWNYLQDNLHGNTPANYFKKFKAFLSMCVETGFINCNPAKDIKLHYSDYKCKKPLNKVEIELLKSTPCNNSEVKKAFLFSCFTGLRWCDIETLSYNNIDFAKRSMNVIQHKVEGHSAKAQLTSYLNDSAMNLLNKNRSCGLVFRLPSYSYSYEILQNWFKASGINKHLSFHCARHSFVSNLIDNGVDLKTVSELAGHSTTKYTERYVHNSEKRLRECVDKLSL